MPYSKNSDLPAPLRKALPSAAQTIFRKTFNSAHEKYRDEIIAFRVAWSAVKKKFRKGKSGKWIKLLNL